MSAIDPTKPVAVVPTTASVRANFLAAKTEIEALQAQVGGGSAITGPLTINLAANTPGITITNSVGWPSIKMSGSPGLAAFYLEAQRSGVPRWALELGGSGAEVGSDSGTNFLLRGFNDAANATTASLLIERANGSTTLTQSGNATLSIINTTNAALLLLDGAAGQIKGAITGRRGGLNRWSMELGSATAESGADAGSNFALRSWTDAGVLLHTPFSIVRSTGMATISRGLTITNTAAGIVFGSTVASAANDFSKHLQLGASAFGLNLLGPIMNIGYPALTSAQIAIVMGTTNRTVWDQTTMTVSLPMLMSGNNGISFGTQVGASNTDLSRHITLNTSGYGMAVTSNRLNYVAPANPATHVFLVGGTDIATIGSTGIAITGGLSTTTAIGSSTNINAGAALTAATFVLAGTNSSAGSMTINGPVSTTRQFRWQTAGLARWSVGMSVDAEGGSDAGATLSINRFNDAGTVIETALSIIRATGSAIVTKGLGMFNTNPPTSKPSVTGSRGGNAALASLLTTLASFGILTDGSSA